MPNRPSNLLRHSITGCSHARPEPWAAANPKIGDGSARWNRP